MAKILKLIARTRALGKSVYVDNAPGARWDHGDWTDGRRRGRRLYAARDLRKTDDDLSRAMDATMYDAEKNIQNVSIVSEGPGVAVVASDSGFKSLKDLIAEAKPKPGTFSGIGAAT